MKISPARVAAFEILMRIETENAFSSVLLPLYEERLSPQDRGLCHEITLGVLRRQMYLDKIIGLLKNAKKLDAAVKIALRMGLYQMRFLDRVPDHSAINESVNLVQMARKTSAKPLVNAVLRRAAREAVKLDYADEIERISVESSHPEWLVEKWIGQFGFEDAKSLAAANNEAPNITFRFTFKSSRKDAKDVKKSEFVEGCFIAEGLDSELRDLAAKGEVYFQDEASQMTAAAVKLKQGDKFLDVCAAPGSKTGRIAECGSRNADLLVAGDLYESRVRYLRQNCANQGVDFVNIVQYDAERSLPFADESFDVVLLDAPCSGTGTIRHNPEIRYFLKPEDFAELSDKQLAILRNASKLVRAGGQMIYSTCSLEVEENEEVCGKFLKENKEFDRVRPAVPARFLTADEFARTFPHRDGMDGFFIAAFVKNRPLE